jgi:hypothetical protein
MAAEGAMSGCPISKVLSARVTMDARLAWNRVTAAGRTRC